MKLVVLALVSVVLVGAAPVPQPKAVQKNFANGGAVLNPDPYPWLATAPLMKNIYWFCDQYEAAKDPVAQERIREGVRQIRRDYQGDLSQRAYACMKSMNAI